VCRFAGLLKGVGEVEDSWLHDGSVAVVVVPPDASVVHVAIRFQLAKWCKVVKDDGDLDGILPRRIRDAILRSCEGLHCMRSWRYSILGRGVGP
jgi:hypothetical protein